MSRAVTADLRRNSIDFLGVSGSYTEKLSSSTNSIDGETVPLRRMGFQRDRDSKKSGDFSAHNGNRTQDDKQVGFGSGRTFGCRPEEYRKIQNYCFRFLEMPKGLFSILYHALLFFLVIVSLILSVLSTVRTKEENYEEVLQTPILVVEIILIVIFVVEYCIRFWAAGCRSAYVGIKGRLRFVVQIYSIIDMIVIISSIVAVSLASNMSSSPIRLLRFLPLLRVLRFDRQGGTWKLLGSVIFVHRQELLTTFYLGFISLIFASFVLYMVEKDSNSEFDSWPSSFWWGIVTLTTVGYGDTVPSTWYGKCCAALFFISGISFFALPAGILGSGFALKVTQQQRQKHFHRRRRPAAILLQSYWRLFCADLDSKSVATWLPSIYYNRQQHLLKVVMEKTGTTGMMGLEDDYPPLSDSQRKRKRSLWTKQKGLRRESYDVQSTRSDSQLTANYDRKASTCSVLDSDFIDENALLALQTEGEPPCIELTNAQKLAIRLIRILKLRVAIRKFKEARRPYDVKDVIEQYSTGHVEMLARIKNLQAKMDKSHRSEGDDEGTGKLDVTKRLSRVEHQVTIIDSKLELVLQMLRSIQNTRESPSGGSNSYDLNFRDNGDGVSSRRSSVTRAHSDPLDVRTQIVPGTHNATNDVVRTSDIPCVTLSYPESCQSSGSRPGSLSSTQSQSQSLHGSLSGGDQHPNLDQLDATYNSDAVALNAPALSRNLGPDKRQLSDVTEADESLADSKETVGGLTPTGPMSQQNSTASDTDPVLGDSDNLAEQKDEEPVWEKREMGLETRRRKRSLLDISESETQMSEHEEVLQAEEKHSDECDSVARYRGTPERRDSLTGDGDALPRGAKGESEGVPSSSQTVQEGFYDASVRSAPTRMSAKRRPLVKSNPVEV